MFIRQRARQLTKNKAEWNRQTDRKNTQTDVHTYKHHHCLLVIGMAAKAWVSKWIDVIEDWHRVDRIMIIINIIIIIDNL